MDIDIKQDNSIRNLDTIMNFMETVRPLVTVGIPVYNAESYIKFSIDSVLTQTLTDFELIITDDGSSDNTLQIIKSYKDKRIKLISDGINRGISYRLNQQISLAKGKYFVRMDGDDIMFPERLRIEIDYLEKHNKVDVVGSKVIIIGKDNEILGIRNTCKNIKNVNDLFLSSRFIHPTTAGKLSWFKKWKYRENMSGVEDFDLWIRSFNESIFVNLDIPLLFYRDPLEFKIRTYFFRKKRLLKSCWHLRKYLDKKMFILVCFVKILFSLLCATLFTIMMQDKKMISRRNTILNDEEKEYYKTILNNII